MGDAGGRPAFDHERYDKPLQADSQTLEQLRNEHVRFIRFGDTITQLRLPDDWHFVYHGEDEIDIVDQCRQARFRIQEGVASTIKAA